MTQIATVERLLAGDYAVISVPRKSACGHDCEECAGCGVTGAAVQARAANPIGAKPGQKVVVQSDTQKMLGIVALVYLTPVVLFLVGYFATIAVASAPIRYLVGGIGFVLGILIAVAYDRRLRRQGGLRFTIVRLF
ncbi:SoxR reducing system RseC family protein [Dysosmobacter sp. Phy]